MNASKAAAVDVPDVSVVICTHNRTADLAANLPGVLASCRNSGLHWEVVVIDNAPSDTRTRDLVVASSCRYVLVPERGLGRARNVGMRASRADVILCVDDDVQVPVNWVRDLSNHLLDEPVDVIAGSVRPKSDRVRSWMGETIRTVLCASLETQDGQVPPHLVGASFGLRRAVYNSVQFEPTLGAGSPVGSGEDVLFYEQVKEAGFNVRGCSCAPVVHHFDLTRLDYRAICRVASSVGRAQAHISHHWLHSRLRFLRGRIVLDLCRVYLLSVRHWEWPGMSDREFNRRAALECKRELFRIRQDQKLYSIRGIVRNQHSAI